MTLSNLIARGGLAKHMTATSATVATPEITNCVSVADVATVAVTTSPEAVKLPQKLIRFVEQCCIGIPVKAQQVIELLLSVDDEQDIINDEIPEESLRLHIKLWVETGKPHYSGKKLETKV
jgi:hypothetical protein